jgi:hypothetical protein
MSLSVQIGFCLPSVPPLAHNHFGQVVRHSQAETCRPEVSTLSPCSAISTAEYTKRDSDFLFQVLPPTHPTIKKTPLQLLRAAWKSKGKQDEADKVLGPIKQH